MAEIWRSPVEGTVVEILLFTSGFSTIQTVENSRRISAINLRIFHQPWDIPVDSLAGNGPEWTVKDMSIDGVPDILGTVL